LTCKRGKGRLKAKIGQRLLSGTGNRKKNEIGYRVEPLKRIKKKTFSTVYSTQRYSYASENLDKTPRKGSGF